MSHLTKHKQKQLLYKTLLFFGLIVAFLVFLVSFGFKIIINGSLFINQLANSGKDTNNSLVKNEILTSLLVDPPPSATNSSRLSVSGSIVNFDMVEIYLNNEKITDVEVNGDTFSEEISGLEKGENVIYFIAKSKKANETKKSSEFTVIYKSDKPKLEVNEPQDNSKTNKQEIKISGKTDKETYVKVNDHPVVVDAQGGFWTLYKLQDGDNKIEIVAEDIVGNKEEKTIKVTYAKDE